MSEVAQWEEDGLRDSAGPFEDVGLRDSGVSQGRNREDGMMNWRPGGVSCSWPRSALSCSGVLSNIFSFLNNLDSNESQCRLKAHID